MMLPLCTIVTVFRLLSIAYWIAIRTSRFVPVSEIGLMPMPESGRMRLPISRRQELDDALGLRRPARPLDAGVDVLGVLAEDDDVHQLGTRDRRRRAREVAHRPHAGVEVEHLAQRDVQAADAAADRRRQRPLDGDLVGLDRLERVVRQPLADAAPWPSRPRAPRTTRSDGLPPNALLTAASNTRTLARQMSGPVPSPSI